MLVGAAGELGSTSDESSGLRQRNSDLLWSLAREREASQALRDAADAERRWRELSRAAHEQADKVVEAVRRAERSSNATLDPHLVTGPHPP